MKKLIIIRGPLGIGKTTVSHILSQNLRLEYLSLDKIIDDNYLAPTDLDEIPLEIYLKANEIIFDLAEKSKNTFVIDGCFYYQQQIDDLVKKFDDNVEIFTLAGHVDTCIERDSKRPKVYGEDSNMVTTKIKAGHEIDNTDLSVNETVEKIMEKI